MSFMLFACTDGCTVMMSGTEPISEMAVKSFTAS
jgi:hypothetical protein